MPTFFDPIQLGSLCLANRVFMAGIARPRATRQHLPARTLVRYYKQRAGAGLIFSEVIAISPQGAGSPSATGIWSRAQRCRWRSVTDAVHAAGGKMFARLHYRGCPHESLRVRDVPRLVDDFRAATRNALAAGFNGVQIEVSDGCAIGQFLRGAPKLRSIRYGRTTANSVRLLREVAQAVAAVAGPDRTGVCLPLGALEAEGAPWAPGTLFAAAAALSEIGVGHLSVRAPWRDADPGDAAGDPILPLVRAIFKQTLIFDVDMPDERAVAALASGAIDAVAFGRPFVDIPDLPRHLAGGLSDAGLAGGG